MSFSLDLSKAIENITEYQDETVRGTIFQLSTNVIKRTPVGNPDYWAPQSLPAPAGYVGGSLRAAWRANIGSPVYDRVVDKSPDASGGSAISGVASQLKSLKVGQDFYLTNALPYAYRVEFGWSRQRPEGMLRVSLTEAQNVLDKVSREVK